MKSTTAKWAKFEMLLLAILSDVVMGRMSTTDARDKILAFIKSTVIPEVQKEERTKTIKEIYWFGIDKENSLIYDPRQTLAYIDALYRKAKDEEETQ